MYIHGRILHVHIRHGAQCVHASLTLVTRGIYSTYMYLHHPLCAARFALKSGSLVLNIACKDFRNLSLVFVPPVGDSDDLCGGSALCTSRLFLPVHGFVRVRACVCMKLIDVCHIIVPLRLSFPQLIRSYCPPPGQAARLLHKRLEFIISNQSDLLPAFRFGCRGSVRSARLEFDRNDILWDTLCQISNGESAALMNVPKY